MAGCVKLAHARVAMERLARKSSTHLQDGCPRPTACTGRRPHEVAHRLCARQPDNLAKRRHMEVVYPCIPDPNGEDEGSQASSSLAVSTRWISVAKLFQSDLTTLAQREGGE
ncbi:hypothetical protein B296_00042533 [Ensete ventricosum]|uniref:Uncharacterized protein n=1 Tax=Ensete ventricosum TaxID=4639 RepID=A0A426X7B8_ENSVE|nr:hypothetical protein B296_00042533 [Ensete ventricosum]